MSNGGSSRLNPLSHSSLGISNYHAAKNTSNVLNFSRIIKWYEVESS